MDYKIIGKIIREKKELLKKDIRELGAETKLEAYDTYVAGEILLLFLENKKVTNKQIIFLKKQSIDFSKVLVLIGLQAIPGSSAAIIVLQKIGEKHGINIIPKPIEPPKV
jgi:hypothetical protein